MMVTDISWTVLARACKGLRQRCRVIGCLDAANVALHRRKICRNEGESFTILGLMFAPS